MDYPQDFPHLVIESLTGAPVTVVYVRAADQDDESIIRFHDSEDTFPGRIIAEYSADTIATLPAVEEHLTFALRLGVESLTIAPETMGPVVDWIRQETNRGECAYCTGPIHKTRDGWVHSTDGERITRIANGDMVSARHNMAGTVVNIVDVIA